MSPMDPGVMSPMDPGPWSLYTGHGPCTLGQSSCTVASRHSQLTPAVHDQLTPAVHDQLTPAGYAWLCLVNAGYCRMWLLPDVVIARTVIARTVVSQTASYGTTNHTLCNPYVKRG